MADDDGHGTDGVERRGLMFVLSSPSGAGKTTLSRLLIDRMPGLKMSVSATTRAMRPGEVDGRDYLFVDKSRFEAMVKGDELLEWATVYDNIVINHDVDEAFAEVQSILKAERLKRERRTGLVGFVRGLQGQLQG